MAWSLLAVLALIMMLTSCDDSTIESPVPAGRVHYSCNIGTINLAMGQGTGQAHIDSPGGYVRIYDKQKLMATDEVGTGGLLLCHDLSSSSVYAYDLACPYCYSRGGSPAEKLHRLTVDGFNAQCDKCGSVFGHVFWGMPTPTSGPANKKNYLLRQYHAHCNGDILVATP
ncbi:MAG: hypothetical protein KBT20_00960 [Bacteroidales bacterium]|nr:hypothetical protein [Candidatus Liminaster caballi]